jgi:phospholipid/cholesterol/gamma-HCH transport system permease protein
MARGAISYRHTLRQMAEVGVGSLFVALITVGFSGAVACLYIAIQLVKLGSKATLADWSAKASRSKSRRHYRRGRGGARRFAMAAELGTMKVTEQWTPCVPSRLALRNIWWCPEYSGRLSCCRSSQC